MPMQRTHLGLRKEITVYEYERGLLYREGKLERVLEPGRYTFWAGQPVEVTKVSLREMSHVVAGQALRRAAEPRRHSRHHPARRGAPGDDAGGPGRPRRPGRAGQGAARGGRRPGAGEHGEDPGREPRGRALARNRGAAHPGGQER